jgi:hypothetical protein
MRIDFIDAEGGFTVIHPALSLIPDMAEVQMSTFSVSESDAAAGSQFPWYWHVVTYLLVISGLLLVTCATRRYDAANPRDMHPVTDARGMYRRALSRRPSRRSSSPKKSSR